MRFAAAADEAAFKRDLEPVLVLWTAVGHAVALCAHVLLVCLVPPEVREELPQRFYAHLGVIVGQALVCGIFGSQAACRWTGRGDWEAASLAATTCLCIALPWLSRWAAATSQQEFGSVGDSEMLCSCTLALDVMVTWYCLFVPARWCRLWLLPMFSWTSLLVQVLLLCTPLPASAPARISALAALLSLVCGSARQSERRAREWWLERGAVRLAHGTNVEAMLHAFSNVVVQLTENLTIVGTHSAHKRFFGWDVEGISLTQLLPCSDVLRFRHLLAHVSASQVPQSMQTILQLKDKRIEASLFVMQIAPAGAARYAIGLQMVRVQEVAGAAATQVESTGRSRSKKEASRGGAPWAVQALDVLPGTPSFQSDDHLAGRSRARCGLSSGDRGLLAMNYDEWRGAGADGLSSGDDAISQKAETLVSLSYTDFSSTSAEYGCPRMTGQSEVGIQASLGYCGNDCGVNTVVTWKDVGFACAKCSKPPLAPGSWRQPASAAARHRDRGRVGSAPSQRSAQQKSPPRRRRSVIF